MAMKTMAVIVMLTLQKCKQQLNLNFQCRMGFRSQRTATPPTPAKVLLIIAVVVQTTMTEKVMIHRVLE